MLGVGLGEPSPLLKDVEILAGGHLGAHPDEFGACGARRLPVVECGEALVEELVAPAEEQVAEEDRRCPPEVVAGARPAGFGVQALEQAMRRRSASSRVGVVDDVVVHECRGVEYLERGCGRDDREAITARVGLERVVPAPRDRLPAPIAEARPEALATAEKSP
jgi:hypothetical protein